MRPPKQHNIDTKGYTMQTVTARNFTRLALSDKESSVVLFADDSPASRSAEQKLSGMAEAFAGPIRFLYSDIDRDPELASEQRVHRAPTLALFTGGRERWRTEGRIQASQLDALRRMLFVGAAPQSPAQAPHQRRILRARAQRAAQQAASAQTLRGHHHVRLRGRPEHDFEEQVIMPLLTAWNLPKQPQAPCRLPGETSYRRHIDVLVYTEDNRRLLTLFENKAMIRGKISLDRAVAQANAYAQSRRLPSFVIAAPEGLWVYSRPNGKPRFEKKFSPEDVDVGAPQVKQLLIELSRRPWAATGNRHTIAIRGDRNG
ncbi:thioredoxin family protein [Oscillochloris sp. ZM17-4]|uniref:thioredoxin family protein n=1 Tax=Oscillochloris sp. ZM17-4 TaxID=2866714 RepID=UPI001C72A24D|nr:thioredoxin family protein [Oscillochloris sp. ZM17-4]MBX0329650.1 thioredoxin family protein [Oscillochloris sp. ZM17-4]